MYLDIYAASERSAKVQTSSCTDICNSGDNEASDICIWNVTKLVSLIGPRPHNMDCDPQYGWRRMDLWYMDLEQGRRVTTLFNLMTKYFFCEADLWGNVYFITTIIYCRRSQTQYLSTLQSMWLPRGDVGRHFASQETPSNCYLSTAPDWDWNPYILPPLWQPSPVLLPCPRALCPAGPGRGLLNSLTPRRRAETRDLHSPNNA